MSEARPLWSEPEQYEALVNWDARRQRELPFYERHLGDRRRILDVACGTGHQALWLAQAGHEVEACDLSPEMLDVARRRALEAGIDIHFFESDMRELPLDRRYDAVLCVGNSLSMLPDRAALRDFLANVALLLSDGGLFLFQVLNYVPILRQGRRHDPVRAGRIAGQEVLFLKSFDFPAAPAHQAPVGRIELATIWREESGWKSRVRGNPMTAFRQEDFAEAAGAAGLEVTRLLGSHADLAYDPESSPDLIGVLTRPA